MKYTRRTSIAAVAAAALCASGCGYHIGGKAALIPAGTHTIAIQAFGNGTIRYELARVLPQDITREFHSRTKYSIITDASQADLVMKGTVTNVSTIPATSDPVTGRATSVQVVVAIQITLTDRHTGKLLYTNAGVPEFRERYEVATDAKSYFDESGAALQRLSRDVAKGVVSAILEAF